MKVLIAGGGTGGHLYPGVAIAEEISTRQPGNEVLFVGTRRGLEARVIPELGYPIEYVEVSGLKGKSVSKLFRGLARLPASLIQSGRIIRRFRPDIALGVGGYASGPAILAAWMLGVPTAVLEQNSVPGLTNRILGKIANAVYVMFESSGAYFPRRKVQALGNPIRKALLDNFLRSKIEDPGKKFNVLVLGGSQGAHTLNLRMVEAAAYLSDIGDALRIIHQTGPADEDLVKRGYLERGTEAEVHAYIEDMSETYRRADLVICRAGASTLAELMVAQKASLLVPFPYASDNHQELNARTMVEAGASRMLVERLLDGRKLAEEVGRLYRNRDELEGMAQAARRAGRPEAGREIVDACVELIEERKR